ncbi:potassium-transporting ATPase, C subunit [mine drainage metagenome]|uniref:Potassium-transporting ATPase, C subunit n=1 Tax=mine drainage metagenome TaxID=410659 RepID=T1CIG4_9ZZZZ
MSTPGMTGPLAANPNPASFVRDGKVLGSRLISQTFTGPRYFWSRPSATAPYPYDADASSGSNLGPTNPALRSAIEQRIAALQAADPGQRGAIPVALVTTSASGLDNPTSPRSRRGTSARAICRQRSCRR